MSNSHPKAMESVGEALVEKGQCGEGEQSREFYIYFIIYFAFPFN